jgi:hypothetical protein
VKKNFLILILFLGLTGCTTIISTLPLPGAHYTVLSRDWIGSTRFHNSWQSGWEYIAQDDFGNYWHFESSRLYTIGEKLTTWDLDTGFDVWQRQSNEVQQ